MRVFLAASLFGYKALFRWFRVEAYVSQKVLLALSQIALFSLIGLFGGRQSLGFYLIGNAMVIVSGSSVFSVGMAVVEERNQGTLLYLVASPANRLALFLGRATLHVGDAALSVVLGFVFAVLVFGLRLPPSTWLGLLAAVLTAALATAGLGLLVGSVAYVLLDASFLGNLAIFTFLLLSGANVPLGDLPPALQAVSRALPLTRSIQAARGVAAGLPLPEVSGLLLADIAVGTVYALVGFAVFQWLEVQARRRGTLEAM